MKDETDAGLFPDDCDSLHQEDETTYDKVRRDSFAEEAERRGLHYEKDKGYYVDENGNAINEFGEKM